MGAAKKVLVIDDSFLIRRMHKAILEKIGFEVLEASNGQDALQKLTESDINSFSLIILDLLMPEMPGEEFMTQLRATYGNNTPKVLVCSSHSDIPIVKKMAELGISGYILKPIDQAHVSRKVKELFPDLETA